MAKCAVILINPFTSVGYINKYFSGQGMKVVAVYTRKNLKRFGYVLEALKNINFHKSIYLNRYSIDQDYMDILSSLEGLNIYYVIIGSEIDDYNYSEVLANRLKRELANCPSTSIYRSNKYILNERLKIHRINSIEQYLAEDYRKNNIEGEVIIKPIQGSSSKKDFQCFSNQDDLMKYIGSLSLKKEHVVQKKIKGQEIIVDCFSYKGVHYIIGINKYYFSNPQLSFFQHVGVLKFDFDINALQEYIFNVLYAAEFKNGLSHIEVIFDGLDYNLIELNPRLPGGLASCSYIDEISYNRHHLNVLSRVISGDIVDPSPAFSGIYSTVFWLNSFNFKYTEIDTNYIKKLKTFNQVNVTNRAHELDSKMSRLNTIAFILLSSKNVDDIHTDINNLQKSQNNGDLFIQ